MRLLVLASSYPYDDYPAAGIYNERSVLALREFCEVVQVVVPRPLGGPVLSRLSPRWKSYGAMKEREFRGGVPVYRPSYLQIPHVSPALWADPGIYLWCSRKLRSIQERAHFDAILAFGLASVGGLAWRLGRQFGIPAAGWATGSDVHSPDSEAHRRVISRSLERLNLVFYQSQYLRNCAADLLRISQDGLAKDRHFVLPRGIPAPPEISKLDARLKMRDACGIRTDQKLVIFIGRIVKGKGIFDLLQAMKIASARDPQLVCFLVGAQPGFDDSLAVEQKLQNDSVLNQHVRLLPSCDPASVWNYLAAADVFAFPSFAEGMPNALLESMAMGVASVAYAIPAVVELDGDSGSVALVPVGRVEDFAEAILRLSSDPARRSAISKKARRRVDEHFMLKANTVTALRRLEAELMKGRRRDAAAMACHSAGPSAE